MLLDHFRGNLDNWDPALVDAVAANRRVIAFDNAGFGGSTGVTPHTFEQMAHDAIAFITAMGFGQTDILGFSIGSFVAQEIALIRHAIVRRLVLASSAPQGCRQDCTARRMKSSAPSACRFFARASSSRQAGQQALQRIYARTEDRDAATTWAILEAQYDALCTYGVPDHA